MVVYYIDEAEFVCMAHYFRCGIAILGDSVELTDLIPGKTTRKGSDLSTNSEDFTTSHVSGATAVAACFYRHSEFYEINFFLK